MQISANPHSKELKLYEIASSLADAVMNLAMLPRAPDWDSESRPSNILSRLHSILSTFRGGGNKTLVDMLYRKMAEAQSRSGPLLARSLRVPQQSTRNELASDGPSQTEETALTQPDPCEFEHFIAVIETPPAHRIDPSLQPGDDEFTRMQRHLQLGQTQLHDDHSYQTTLNDATECGFGEATLNPSYVAYPACSQDPGYMAQSPPTILETGNTPTLSPSWPAHSSVEMMIGDFISQIPDGRFPDESTVGSFLTSDDLTREVVDVNQA